MNHPAAGATTLRKLFPAALLGERVGASDAVRQQHGGDESVHPHCPTPWCWPFADSLV